MARTRREYLFRNYDPVRGAIERWAGWHVRDAGGLPLGDVYKHAANRLIYAYRILKAADVAIKLDRLTDPEKLSAVAASVQDKKGTRFYPAAHLAPCGVAVGKKPGGRPLELYDLFGNPINKSYVKGISAATEPVHVLVNTVDNQLDRTRQGDGFSNMLITSVRKMVKDYKARPKEIFYDELAPGYRSLAQKRLIEWRTGAPFDIEPVLIELGIKLYDSNDRLISGAAAGRVGLYDHTGRQYGKEAPEGLSPLVDSTGRPYGEEAPEGPSPFVDLTGNPLVERPSDVSVNSKSREAAIYTDQTMEKIYSAYAGAKPTPMDELRSSDSAFVAIERNEREESKS